MQYTLVLQLNNSTDFQLMIDLAKRLKIAYFEVESQQFPLSNARKETASFLFEGLDIPQKTSSFQLNHLPITQEDSNKLNNYNPTGFSNALKEVGGVWQDEEESLEEILAMLK